MNKIRLDDKDIYYQVFYKNNKNMYLRIKDNKIIITCNKAITKDKIEAFIKNNETGILNKIKSIQKKVPLYNSEAFLLFGKTYDIQYKTNELRNQYRIVEDTIYISFASDDFNEMFIETIYKQELIKKMKTIFEAEKPALSKYFDVNNLVFKAQLMKSRFGSCIPSKKTIKLNTILARFSPIYTRTILIHEMIHLKVHNHQKDFYTYIDHFVPNYKAIIKQMNNLTRKYVI